MMTPRVSDQAVRDGKPAQGRFIARSLGYGYAGAVLGGLLVAVIGMPFGLTVETAPTLAVPAGLMCGAAGLLIPLRQRVRARLPARSNVRAAPRNRVP